MAKSKTIRELLVRLGVKTDKEAAEAFDKTLQSVKRSMFAVAAAAGAAAAGIFGIAKSVADRGEKVKQTAEALNLTTDAVQELDFAFRRFGADTSDVSDAFNTLTDRAEDAKQGMQSFIDDIKLVNITVDDLKKKKPEELFNQFADAIAGMEDTNRRNTAVVRLLGDDLGSKLIPLLSRGADGINDLRQQAQALGLVMSEEAIESTREFENSMVAVKGILTGLKNQIGLAFIPAITQVAERVTDWYLANSQIIKSRINDTLERFKDRLEQAANFARDLWEQIEILVDRVGGWDRVLTTVASTIAAIGAMKAFGFIITAVKGLTAIFSVLGVKVIAIAALIAGLGLAIQDVITYFRGGESFTGDFIEALEDGEGVVFELSDGLKALGQEAFALFEDMRDLAMEAIVPLKEIVGVILDGLEPAFGPALRAAKAFGRFFVSMLRLNLQVAGAIFKAIAGVVIWWWSNVIKPVFEAIMPLVGPILGFLLDGFTTAFGWMADLIGWFVDLFTGKFGTVSDWWEGFVDLIRTTFGKAIDWIVSKLDMVVGKFNRARDMASRLPGLEFLGTEGAAQEAAAPQRAADTQTAAMAASIGDTNIQVDASGSDASADEIADKVAQKQEASYSKRLQQAREALTQGREL